MQRHYLVLLAGITIASTGWFLQRTRAADNATLFDNAISKRQNSIDVLQSSDFKSIHKDEHGVLRGSLVIFDLDKTLVIRDPETGKTKLADPRFPALINKLKNEGIIVIGETSGSVNQNNWKGQPRGKNRPSDLEQLDLKFSLLSEHRDDLPFVDYKILEDNDPDKSATAFCGGVIFAGRKWINKIAFLENPTKRKGPALEKFLQALRTGNPQFIPTDITFVDDTFKKLESVKETLTKQGIPFRCIWQLRPQPAGKPAPISKNLLKSTGDTEQPHQP